MTKTNRHNCTSSDPVEKLVGFNDRAFESQTVGINQNRLGSTLTRISLSLNTVISALDLSKKNFTTRKGFDLEKNYFDKVLSILKIFKF